MHRAPSLLHRVFIHTDIAMCAATPAADRLTKSMQLVQDSLLTADLLHPSLATP